MKIDIITGQPTIEPERLTDDDVETIRIHLSAFKEKLCNQGRYREAEEYQRLIDRFMAFASAYSDIPAINAVDIISRQAAIDAIWAHATKILESHDYNVLTRDVYKMAHRHIVELIQKLPPAQPEQKTGLWVPHIEKSREYIGTVLVNVRYDYWLCDTCGYRVKNGQPMYNYCPNCGAKMEKKVDEQDQR